MSGMGRRSPLMIAPAPHDRHPWRPSYPPSPSWHMSPIVHFMIIVCDAPSLHDTQPATLTVTLFPIAPSPPRHSLLPFASSFLCHLHTHAGVQSEPWHMGTPHGHGQGTWVHCTVTARAHGYAVGSRAQRRVTAVAQVRVWREWARVV